MLRLYVITSRLLLVEGLVLGDLGVDTIKIVTAKELYAGYTTTFPLLKIVTAKELYEGYTTTFPLLN